MQLPTAVKLLNMQGKPRGVQSGNQKPGLRSAQVDTRVLSSEQNLSGLSTLEQKQDQRFCGDKINEGEVFSWEVCSVQNHRRLLWGQCWPVLHKQAALLGLNLTPKTMYIFISLQSCFRIPVFYDLLLPPQFSLRHFFSFHHSGPTGL